MINPAGNCVQVIDPIHPAGIARLAARYDLVPPGAAPTDAQRASMRGMALAVADLVDRVMAGERPATLLNPQALGKS